MHSRSPPCSRVRCSTGQFRGEHEQCSLSHCKTRQSRASNKSVPSCDKIDATAAQAALEQRRYFSRVIRGGGSGGCMISQLTPDPRNPSGRVHSPKGSTDPLHRYMPNVSASRTEPALQQHRKSRGIDRCDSRPHTFDDSNEISPQNFASCSECFSKLRLLFGVFLSQLPTRTGSRRTRYTIGGTASRRCAGVSTVSIRPGISDAFYDIQNVLRSTLYSFAPARVLVDFQQQGLKHAANLSHLPHAL